MVVGAVAMEVEGEREEEHLITGLMRKFGSAEAKEDLLAVTTPTLIPPPTRFDLPLSLSRFDPPLFRSGSSTTVLFSVVVAGVGTEWRRVRAPESSYRLSSQRQGRIKRVGLGREFI